MKRLSPADELRNLLLSICHIVRLVAVRARFAAANGLQFRQPKCHDGLHGNLIASKKAVSDFYEFMVHDAELDRRADEFFAAHGPKCAADPVRQTATGRR